MGISDWALAHEDDEPAEDYWGMTEEEEQFAKDYEAEERRRQEAEEEAALQAEIEDLEAEAKWRERSYEARMLDALEDSEGTDLEAEFAANRDWDDGWEEDIDVGEGLEDRLLSDSDEPRSGGA
jgi:hypothetical protein